VFIGRLAEMFYGLAANRATQRHPLDSVSVVDCIEFGIVLPAAKP